MSIPLLARTAHLELVAATVPLIEAELSGAEALGVMLDVMLDVCWM